MKYIEALRKKLSLNFVVIIMCGVIASLSCAAMWVSRSFNPDCFYDVGNVYDVPMTDREKPEEGLVYSQEDQALIVTEPSVMKVISLKGEMRSWKTLIVVLGNMNRESLDWQLYFRNGKGELVDSQQVRLTEGENVLSLSEEKFAYMEILISGSEENIFSIDKMQFCENAEIINMNGYPEAVLVFFMLYLGIVWIGHTIYKKCLNGKQIDFYIVISKLQDVYIKIGEAIPDMQTYPEKYVRAGRRSLLLGMLYYMLVINNKDTYYKGVYYPRHVLVWGLFLFGIAVLSKERPLKKLNWRNAYMGIWTVFWIMICISDFIVKKRFCGWGWLMLLVVGFLFFVWGNMEKPQQLFKDIIRSVEYFSVINLVFCLVARPKIEGYSYSGIAWNPNIYAQYLMPMCVVFLAELLEWIDFEKKGKMWIFDLVMVISSCYMGWISQSRTGVLSLAVVLLIFLLKVILCLGNRERRKKCWAMIIAFTILTVPVTFLSNWCLTTIPHNLGTQVIFPRDDYKIEVYMPSLTLNVEAAGIVDELSESKIAQKFMYIGDMERFTSGRLLYWEAYLRNMNLWGHEFQLEIWGIKRGEHSAFITIAYRYGVFAIVPYLLLIFCTIQYAWRYCKDRSGNNRYRFYPIGIAIGMVCIMLVENVERPFYSVSCLTFYLLPGIFQIMDSSSGMEAESNKKVAG